MTIITILRSTVRAGWDLLRRRQVVGLLLPAPPRRIRAAYRPRRLKPNASGRRQNWRQACCQWAYEHEGLHAWPTIGWQRVRQAVVKPRRSGDLLLSIELDVPGLERWQHWQFSNGGRDYEFWGVGAQQGRLVQDEGDDE